MDEICDLAPFVAAHLEPLRSRASGDATIEPPHSPTEGDSHVVARLLANPRHAALYRGDLTGCKGISEAEQVLCNVLALQGCTPAQVEAIWLASPIGQREKTQRRKDYRQLTIAKAFNTQPPKLPSVDTSNLTYNGVPLFQQASVATPADTPTLIDAAELAAMPASPRLDMWGGNVPVAQVTLFFGGGGSGKSLLLQQLASSTALGFPMFGIQSMSGVALYITCEDDIAELHRRQHDICRSRGTSFAHNKRRLALVSLTNVIGNELAAFDAQGRMVVMPRFHWLRDTIIAIGAKLVVLDNVAHFFAGNENVRNHVAAFLGLLNMLAHKSGAAIILIAHTNKSGEGSGSTAWLNQVRTALKLEIPADANGFIDDFDARVLTRIKSNYSRTGERIAFRWHQGAFKATVELPDDLANQLASNAKSANDERLFLACLAERTRQRRAVSELVSKTYAPTVFARMVESEGIGKLRLEQAMDRLFKAGAIERGFLWRDTAEGKDRHGLRETSANAPVNHPPTRPANVRQLDGEPPPSDPPTLPIYYVNGGGADPEGSVAPPPQLNGGAP